MSTLYDSIMEHLEICRERMRENGIPDEVIDDIIGGPSDSLANLLPGTRYLNTNSKSLASLLDTNTFDNTFNEAFGDTFKNAFSDAFSNKSVKADATSVTVKYPQTWIGKTEVVIVLDYTDKTHALFGDFVKAYSSFRTNYLKTNSFFHYAPKLSFGAGWTLNDKTKLPEVRKALKNAAIPYREVKKDDFIKELEGSEKKGGKNVEKNEPKVVEVSEGTEEDETPVPKTSAKNKDSKGKDVKSTTGKGKEPVAASKPKPSGKVVEKNEKSKTVDKKEPVKGVKGKDVKSDTKKEVKNTKNNDTNDEQKPVKRRIVKNKYGNYEEEETGLVFLKLPVGPKAKEINVVIGYQDPAPGKNETKLDTVMPLTDEHIEVAEKSAHHLLTDEIIDKVRKYDAVLADQLLYITIRNVEFDDINISDMSDISDNSEDDFEEGDDSS